LCSFDRLWKTLDFTHSLIIVTFSSKSLRIYSLLADPQNLVVVRFVLLLISTSENQTRLISKYRYQKCPILVTTPSSVNLSSHHGSLPTTSFTPSTPSTKYFFTNSTISSSSSSLNRSSPSSTIRHNSILVLGI
jgi:hypothetical protein